MRNYDVVVLGLGVMGSAVADRLARSGARVLGIDRFAPLHDRGSSHGETRVIRKAYFEHENYVPLLLRAYELWKELEDEFGETLFTRTQCLVIGDADDVVVRGCRRSADTHRLASELLDRTEMEGRFSLRAGPRQIGVLEPDGGYLRTELCIRAFQSRARAHGAELRFEKSSLGWNATDDGVTVEVEGETVHARRLVLCLGSWTSKFANDAQLPLAPKRTVQFWFESKRRGHLPVFIQQTATGPWIYGFPERDGLVKVAFHNVFSDCDPDTVDRRVHDDESAAIRGHAERILGPLGACVKAKTCLYTMTPDEHFVIGPLPGFEKNVTITAGFSGHGFKFASVVGEIVGDLVAGRTREDIALFAPTRFTRQKG